MGYYAPIEEKEVEMVETSPFGVLEHEVIRQKRENLKMRQVEDWTTVNKKNRH